MQVLECVDKECGLETKENEKTNIQKNQKKGKVKQSKQHDIKKKNKRNEGVKERRWRWLYVLIKNVEYE